MIDLDKSKAARREAKGEGPKVKFGGNEYELAPELPFAAIEALNGLQSDDTAAGALVDLAAAILGEHFEAVKAAGLSMDDINELIGSVMQEYGVDAPLPSTAS
jgi:hypothetical protein